MKLPWLASSLALLAACGTTWGTVRESASPVADSRPLVHVWLNGQGPFDFVIDTGSDGCVVSEKVATLLQIPVGREIKITGGGGTLNAHRLFIRSVEVAGLRVENVPFAMVKLPVDSGDGMLGNTFLKAYRVTLDFRHSQVRLDAP